MILKKIIFTLLVFSIVLMGCNSGNDIAKLTDELGKMDQDTTLAEGILNYMSFLDEVFMEDNLDTQIPDLTLEIPEDEDSREFELWRETADVTLGTLHFANGIEELKQGTTTEEEFKEFIEKWKDVYSDGREDYIVELKIILRILNRKGDEIHVL